MPNASHAPQAVNEALAAYLTAQIAGLTVLTEWPYANQKLTYPSVSIFAVDPRYTNFPPRIVTKTPPDVNNQSTVTYEVGAWDYTIQLDLWCRNKVERNTVLGQLADAINPSPGNGSAGLALTLASYYNEIARLDIDRQKYVQDESASQRQEWRGLITLLVNVRAIKQQTMYAIKSLEVDLGVPSSDDQMTDDASNTEQHLIF